MGFQPIENYGAIFCRRTCNDIDCHVFLLHRVIMILLYEVLETGRDVVSTSERHA